MKPSHVTAVFVSRDAALDVCVKRIRTIWPDDPIVLVIPSGVTVSPSAIEKADAQYDLPPGAFGLWRIRRRLPCLRFVVLFPSRRLRLAAALAGVRERHCCTVSGEVFPLGGTIIGSALGLMAARLVGMARYLWLWASVRLSPLGR